MWQPHGDVAAMVDELLNQPVHALQHAILTNSTAAVVYYISSVCVPACIRAQERERERERHTESVRARYLKQCIGIGVV